MQPKFNRVYAHTDPEYLGEIGLETHMKDETSRRVFLEKLGACALSGTTLSELMNRRASALTAAAWDAPPKMTNPNILVIILASTPEHTSAERPATPRPMDTQVKVSTAAYLME